MSDIFKYARVVEYVAARLWAINPVYLPIIRGVIGQRAAGFEFTAAEKAAALAQSPMAAHPGEPVASNGGVVAVIPLTGIIAHRAEAFADLSGPQGTSIEWFMQKYRQAIQSPSVKAILVDINSPGGTVDGVPEAADEILSLRGQKPVVAVANTFAASAAYWLGSAFDELVASPSADVGSIGVYSIHQDVSKMLENQGVSTTLISAGKYKIEGNPFGPLSEETLAHMQNRIDAIHAEFVAAVAAQRGVSSDLVANDFGQGRTLPAKAALAAGMIDRIETAGQALARLVNGGKNRSGGRQAKLDANFLF